VLDKVELFIIGGDGEIIPGGGLIRPFGPERRIGHDAVIRFSSFGLINGISQVNVGLNPVEI